MNQLTHLDENGAARMVDVSEKTDTVREAMAAGSIRMSAECFALVKNGAVKQGDVLSVARIAGIMGAKKTFELVPLCHCIGLTGVELEFLMHEENCEIEAHCRTKTVGKTGVEMEALTGVQIALLTIYDMCKAIDRGMVMTDIRLLKKSGGKSGIWEG